MNFEKAWTQALKNTEILRARVQSLQTFRDTPVPYILLSESSINIGDTVVRKGEVLVKKPSLILPPNIPKFEGFEFPEPEAVDENQLINFLLVRGVDLPSLTYDNKTHSVDVFEGNLAKAVKHYRDLLESREDVLSGLLTCPEDCWQFSLLIFICSQAARNANTDIKKLLEEFKRKEGGS